MNEMDADLERMTDSNSHLGTDADGNDHHTVPAGDGRTLAWIVSDGDVVFDQVVDLDAYVAHVDDVTGWESCNHSHARGLGDAVCEAVDATDEEASA